MIRNMTPENYKNILKISIVPAKSVNYPLQYVLQKRNIVFDNDQALIICPLPEDLTYPSSSKMSDSGMFLNYKIGISITDQSELTEEQLMKFYNQKVIVVLHYNNEGRMIIGCNENPLMFMFEDDNSTNPAKNNGYNVECSGNTYFTKVNL